MRPHPQDVSNTAKSIKTQTHERCRDVMKPRPGRENSPHAGPVRAPMVRRSRMTHADGVSN